MFHAVRAGLLTAQFRPGQWMKVSDLQRRFGVSISVVREALNRLTAEGLLQSSAQRGFRVADLSLADLQDLTDARIKIEPLVLRESLESGSAEWEAEVVAAHHMLTRTPVQSPDGTLNPEWMRVHASFHEVLLAGCPNAHLRSVATSLRDKAEMYRMGAPLPDGSGKVAAEHRPLMDLALARRKDEAAALLVRHIDHARQAVAGRLATPGAH
ncbi:GntR family transcriptional regulator [Streptomyces sp. NPDC058274]|uniref:GntR family transcriptional regulator n=1 Tax=Streptomyces sp. NPDC058274 TaxID=3346416 RepID=UPI0036F186AE